MKNIWFVLVYIHNQMYTEYIAKTYPIAKKIAFLIIDIKGGKSDINIQTIVRWTRPDFYWTWLMSNRLTIFS